MSISRAGASLWLILNLEAITLRRSLKISQLI
jgi:hypothetical protein